MAPIISAQPQDASATAGQSATFSVTASGDAPLTYQWLRNGIAISGATASTYAFSPVMTTDDGAQFTVKVTNAAGSVASTPAVLHVLAVSGSVSVLVGMPGGSGYTDGTGSAARFSGSAGTVAVDSNGTTYVPDAGNYTIRKVTSAGVVTTIAGLAGTPGYIDGVGSGARFNMPGPLVLDGLGNLYVGDNTMANGEGTRLIRKIAPDGMVTTFSTSAVSSFTVDNAGNLYWAKGTQLGKFASDGSLVVLAGDSLISGYTDGPGNVARFSGTTQVFATPSGSVYVLDAGNNALRLMTPAGTVSTVTTSTVFDNPNGINACVDPAGELLEVQISPTSNVSDSTDVYKSSAAGVVQLLSGSNLISPHGVGCGPDNSLLAMSGYVLDKLTLDGQLTSLAGAPAQTGYVDGAGSAVRFSALNVVPYLPTGIVTDSVGNAYIGDPGNSAIREVTPSGVVSTLALAKPSGGYNLLYGNEGEAIDPAGNIYVLSIQIDDQIIYKVSTSGVLSTYSRPGFPTTQTSNSFVTALAYDPRNGLDAASVYGVVSIVPSGAYTPLGGAPVYSPGMAIDAAGNIFISTGRTVGKLLPNGSVQTIAGDPSQSGYQDGVGTAALFNATVGSLAVDANDNLYLIDDGNLVIRKITPGGMVTTVAGTPGKHQVVVGSPGGFSDPSGIAVMSTSPTVLYVTDGVENVVLSVTAP